MIKVRKGLFETASSSEDSLSVCQDMKLYILAKDFYEKFKNGELYIKFDALHPSVSDDFLYKSDENDKVLKDKHFQGDQIPAAYIAGKFEKLFLSFDEYISYLNREYSDYNLFEYENGYFMIFGFYGYEYY